MANLDGNGLRAPKPNEELAKSIQGAIKRGHNRYLKNGETILLRYKSRVNAQTTRNKSKYGLSFEEEPLAQRNINRGSEARRAATNEQTLTKKDYLDYAKRNGYPAEQAVQLYQENEARLRDLKGQKSAAQHYEHLLPTRSPMRGGVEHYRNIVMMSSEQNLAKSDYLASMPAAREAGVPLTKQGALFADFNQLPLPTDQERVDTILKDIASQESPKTTRDVRSALQQSELAEPVGQKFKFNGGSVRLNAKNLAIAGLLSYGAFGTAASAAETVERTKLAQQTGDPLDILQAGISGVSTAADVAAYNPIISPAAEAVSTTADVANIGIDAARSIDIGNELKYIGGQVRLGKLPYGLEQAAGWIKSAF